MIVVIVTGGTIRDYSFTEQYIKNKGEYFLIACDKGLEHCEKMGLTPNIIIGDFDSADPSVLEKYTQKGIEILRYPVMKDKTDTEIGLDKAKEMNAEKIFVFAGIGSRIDHTLANIQLLSKFENATLVNENNQIKMLCDNSSVVIEKGKNYYISLIPMTPKAEGVTAKGMAYPLENACMYMDSSLGISNYVTEDKAEISLKKGKLLVIKAKDM